MVAQSRAVWRNAQKILSGFDAIVLKHVRYSEHQATRRNAHSPQQVQFVPSKLQQMVAQSRAARMTAQKILRGFDAMVQRRARFAGVHISACMSGFSQHHRVAEQFTYLPDHLLIISRAIKRHVVEHRLPLGTARKV